MEDDLHHLPPHPPAELHPRSFIFDYLLDDRVASEPKGGDSKVGIPNGVATTREGLKLQRVGKEQLGQVAGHTLEHHVDKAAVGGLR